jgi:hypothetical protein
MWFRDRRSGMEKSLIRDKHPGSATLASVQAHSNTYVPVLAAVWFLRLSLHEAANTAASGPLQETGFDPVPAVLHFVLAWLQPNKITINI